MGEEVRGEKICGHIFLLRASHHLLRSCCSNPGQVQGTSTSQSRRVQFSHLAGETTTRSANIR